MSIKILPSTEVRDHMARVMHDVAESGDSCFITQHGKAEVVMLSVDRFNELMSLVEDSLDERDDMLVAKVKQARDNYKKGKGVPFDV